MTTYLVVEITVTDPELYEEYRAQATSLLAEIGGGGRMLARGGRLGNAETINVEGDWDPDRFAMVEFPTKEAAEKFYYSDQYQEALAVRKASSTSKALLITAATE